MPLSESELAAHLGHGCDDLEHKLLLRACLVHFDLQLLRASLSVPLLILLILSSRSSSQPHKDALFSGMTSTPPCQAPITLTDSLQQLEFPPPFTKMTSSPAGVYITQDTFSQPLEFLHPNSEEDSLQHQNLQRSHSLKSAQRRPSIGSPFSAFERVNSNLENRGNFIQKRWWQEGSPLNWKHSRYTSPNPVSSEKTPLILGHSSVPHTPEAGRHNSSQIIKQVASTPFLLTIAYTLEKKLEKIRISEAVEGPAEDANPHRRPLCFNLKDAIFSPQLLRLTNGHKGRLIRALHQLNSQIEWENDLYLEVDSVLGLLQQRIEQLRKKSYSLEGAHNRSPFQILFRDPPYTHVHQGENYTPQFGHFPTRKLRPNLLTRPYFSRSTDSNKGYYLKDSESQSGEEIVRPNYSAEIYSEEFRPALFQNSSELEVKECKGKAKSPRYSTPDIRAGKGEQLTTPGGRITTSSTPRERRVLRGQHYESTAISPPKYSKRMLKHPSYTQPLPRRSEQRLETRVSRFNGDEHYEGKNQGRMLRQSRARSRNEETAQIQGDAHADIEFQGLKNICIEVFNYIYKKKADNIQKFHKKQIASDIVKKLRYRAYEMSPGFKSQPEGSPAEMSPVDYEKQDKNVRRRVYDAINVLLAMDVLQEGAGKEVGFKEQQSYLSRSLFRNFLQNDKQFGVGSLLGNNLSLKSKQLEEKKKQKVETMLGLIAQNFSIKNFKRRNQTWVLNETQRLMQRSKEAVNDPQLKMLASFKERMEKTGQIPKVFLPKNEAIRRKVIESPFVIIKTPASEENKIKFVSLKSQNSSLNDSLTLQTSLPHSHVTFPNFLELLNIQGANFKQNLSKLQVRGLGPQASALLQDLTPEALLGLRKK